MTPEDQYPSTSDCAITLNADDDAAHQFLLESLDKQLSAEAKEAIALLNNAAIELYPESADYGRWSGPLEYVNQSLYDIDDDDNGDFEEEIERIKEAVLNVYNKAITDRDSR